MASSDYPASLDAHVYDRAVEARVELGRACRLFAPFNSPHEGLAVIEEELHELRVHVYANTARGRDARAEAIQLAAMALRFVLDLSDTP